MTEKLAPPQPSSPGSDRPSRSFRPRTPLGWVVAVLGAITASVAVLALIVTFAFFSQPDVPSFTALSEHPDGSLHGTVAYMSDETGCVRIRAASGQPVKDVYCPPAQDVGKAVKLGKELGPQLVWLPDGRLEVTMFRMTDPPGPGFDPGWQRIVDVRTGAVEEVPASKVPSTPNKETHPVVSPSGERVGWTSEGGRVEVTLTESGKSRTLMNEEGPADGYRLDAAFWAPSWQWVAADDGRILVITTGPHPVTRLLTSERTGTALEPQLSRFAVTAEDLFSSAK